MMAPDRRIAPGPGQESVWDYPRPPRVEALPGRVRVSAGDLLIAESTTALRVLETSHPPVVYVPPSDVRIGGLTRNARRTFCEYKGQAAYHDLAMAGGRIDDVAWSYPNPTPAFAALRNYLAFYPSRVECFVDDERVTAQPGDFYGGWITSRVVGPFKGGPGTFGW